MEIEAKQTTRDRLMEINGGFNNLALNLYEF